MAKIKTYQIVINGIKENITAANNLNEALNKISSVIDKINSKSVNSSTNGGNSTVDTSGLQEQDKIMKTISATEQRINEVRSEEYQTLLKTKDALSEAKKESDAMAASARLSAKEYDHTLNGLKKLAKDIKTVMGNTNINDDEFKKLNKVLGDVNAKIKELTKETKNFGSAGENVKQVTVTVGGVERVFNSVRDASRQLSQELKAMVINGQENTKEFNELAEAVHNFEMASQRAESAVNDLKASSKGMDDILDTFQSFTALGQVGQGLSAFFGIDDTEINRSIQKLVGLQNALQGIETIRKQMNTQEGIGKWLSRSNQGIDKFVANLTGAKVGMEGLVSSSKGATLALRGFSMALKGIGIGVLIFGITELVSALGRFIERMNYAKVQAKSLDETLSVLNKTYEKRKEALDVQFIRGEVNDEEYTAQRYKLQNDYLKEQINLLIERSKLSDDMYVPAKIDNPNTVFPTQIPSIEKTVKDFQELEEVWRKCNEAANEGKDYWEKWGSGANDWFKSLRITAADTKDAMTEIEKIGFNQFILNFQKVVEEFSKGKITAQQYRQELQNLSNSFNNSQMFQHFVEHLEEVNAETKKNVEDILSQLKKIEMFNLQDELYWNDVRRDGEPDSVQKIKERLQDQMRMEIAQTNATEEQKELLRKKYQRLEQNEIKQFNEQQKSKAKQHAQEMENIEKQYRSLKIAQMKNGFEKEKAQLEEERRQRIKSVQNAENVPTATKEKTIAEINKEYDKRILDAKRDWSYNMVKTYEDMYNQIEKLTRDGFNKTYQIAKDSVEDERFRSAEFLFFNPDEIDVSDSLKAKIAKYQETLKQLSENPKDTELRKQLGESQLTVNEDIEYWDAYYKKLLEIEEKANERFDEIEEERLGKELDFNKKEENLRHKRQVSMETSNLVIENLNKYATEHNGADLLLQGTQEEINNLEQQLRPQLEQMRGILVDAYNKGEIDFKSFLNLIEQEEIAHENTMRNLENQHSQDVAKLNQDSYNKRSQATVQYYNNLIHVVQSGQNELEDITKRDFTKTNSWQIFDIGAAKRVYRKAIEDYKNMSQQLMGAKLQLKNDLAAHKISATEFLLKDSELAELIRRIKEQLEGLEEGQKEMIPNFVQSISKYVTAVADSFNTIMDAVWNAQDMQFDKEQEELDKENEMLKDKLSEQRSILEEHTSNVESIESELATARGSRREELIDQLNAEMAARKEARKQEKKLEKEEEKQKKKQEELDKKRKIAEYNRQILQAVVNGSMSVTYAAMNTWPIPAIPMMALAAATTAAQIAIMRANKPYANGGQLDGGVAVGNRHRDGGIKVLGGHAEIEGGEFITNRYTTSKNVDLLSYINSKKKKIDVSDLLEFYGGKSVKKSVASVSSFKYENGGLMPTMTNDYNIDDRLLAAFESYSNRPVVVSVVDINKRQNAVRNVRVLAGLDA